MKIDSPKDIKFEKLGTLIIDGFQNGLYKPEMEYGSGVQIIRINDFNNEGKFTSSILSRVNVNETELRIFQLNEKDILVNRVNSLSHLGKSMIIGFLVEPTIYESNMMRLHINEDAPIIPEYVAYFLKTDEVRNRLRRLAKRAVAQSSINQDDVSSLVIPLYPIQNQRIIVHALQTWDSAIEKTERLIEAKKKYLKYLVNKLVSDKTYPKAFVRDITTELSIRNNGEQYNRVLSVTNINGFVLPENQFERRVASEDLSNYKVVRRGQYAYNPSRINVGSIARLDDWPEGVLSPMYVVFSLDEKRINSDFFLHWLSSYEARERIKRSAQGSVRETVGFQSFGDIAIPLPPLDKQLKIAELLNIARKEIDLLKRQLEALRKQKRGLMQKLLTGEWRVKTATEEE